MQPFDPWSIPLEGTHLIEASAGTGKTYNITSLFLRFIVESDLKVQQILVVTFTEAATRELRERIRRRLREPAEDPVLLARLEKDPAARKRIQEALLHFDEASILTIHGFCHRMLQDNAFESGMLFDAELVPDITPLIEEVVLDFWGREVYAAHPLFVEHLLRENIRPSSLVKTCSKVLSRQGWEWLPREVPESHPEARYEAVYARAHELWAGDREEIRTILRATYDGLNKQSYKAGALEGDLRKLEREISSGRPRLPSDGGAILLKYSQTRLVAKIRKKERPPEHPFFQACDELRLALQGFEQKQLAFLRALLDYSSRELAKRKRERHLLSFDDLLAHLWKGLQGPGGQELLRRIRAQYRAGLVDECQDTDPLQFKIFSEIFPSGQSSFFQIGDPKQSIFAFRGADVYAYLRAGERVEHRFTLDTNHRSDPSLVTGINLLFQQLEQVRPPFLHEGIHYWPVSPSPRNSDALCGDAAVQIRWIGQEGNPGKEAWPVGLVKEQLPLRVGRDIQEFLGGERTLAGRPVRPDDIAILVRRNQEAFEMQEALRHFGIRSVVMSAESVFSSEEAGDLRRLLVAILDPQDGGLVRAALATAILGLDGLEIASLQDDPGTSEVRFEPWVVLFREWHGLWGERGFIQMMHELLHAKLPGHGETVQARILRLPGGERRMTNLLHLTDLLHEATYQEHLGMEGLFRWFDRQRLGEAKATDASQLRLESDDNAVKLVTIHKSKGLEYPIVFCPFLWDSALQSGKGDGPVPFHDPADGYQPKLDLGEDKERHRLLERRESMEESLRLLYVAITRAKHQVHLYLGLIKGSGSSPLGYLLFGNLVAGEWDPQGFGKLLEAISEETLLSHLRSVEAQSGGRICLSETSLAVRQDRAGPPRQIEIPLLRCLQATRKLRRAMRTASFSDMTRLSSEDRSAHEDRTLAHMDFSGEPLPPPLSPLPEPQERIPLADFARGPSVGVFLHEFYEDMDFTNDDPIALDALLDEKIGALSIWQEKWREPLKRSILDSLGTPLDPHDPDLVLQRIAPAKRINELEFLFPACYRGESRGFFQTGESLRDTFAAHPSPAMTRGTLESLGKLRFAEIRGFLKGFIDLVFFYEGRYYLVDYKSNMLGETVADYREDRLRVPMEEHLYLLQYHLYTLALHRYLATRIADYDYERHFGGVFYLFIRGMSPKYGPGYGIFRDRPALPLIQALDSLLVEEPLRGARP